MNGSNCYVVGAFDLRCRSLPENEYLQPVASVYCHQFSTAGIMSLRTHICIPVALNIDVHPKLTYEHQSPYHQGLHTQLCNPSCSDSCKP